MSPFAKDDIVETIKGAKFWGKVLGDPVSVAREYQIIGGPILEGPNEWRVQVFAIHPEFYGTIHIYPASQLQLKKDLAAS